MKMPTSNDTQSIPKEDRIPLATQAFQKGRFRSIHAAAREYDIAYSTRRDRLHGRQT